jgi:hypothetical protein
MFKKALKITKLIFQMAIVMLMGFAISLGIHISIKEALSPPTPAELKSLDNISSDLDAKEANVVKRSRNSILQVLSGRQGMDGFAKMSGTYVTRKDKFYVITAAHGIMGECDHFYVATSDSGVYECIRYIVVNKGVDYAIIEIEEVPHRVALKLSTLRASNRMRKQELSVLTDVFYTGYPNSLGPLTFRGAVAGLSRENYIYLHSYAWPGSSGAGVFSYNGHMIGIVIALNVGLTSAGYDVLEDLVIVTPLFKIDWELVYGTMEEPEPLADTGDTAE